MLEIPSCFSYDVIVRYIEGQTNPGVDVVVGSQVNLLMDNSNQQISSAIQSATLAAYDDMMQFILPFYNKSSLGASLPVQQMAPIYGESNPSFTDFVAPRYSRNFMTISPLHLFIRSI